MLPFARVPDWVAIFDPQPFGFSVFEGTFLGSVQRDMKGTRSITTSRLGVKQTRYDDSVHFSNHL